MKSKAFNVGKAIFFISAAVIFIYLGTILATYYTTRQILKQARIVHEIGDMPEPEKEQKILVFSPHQDDETIAAGGYMATAVENGATVSVVLVTDGNKYRVKTLRYSEFKKATKIIGVKNENLTFLNYPDGSLARQDRTKLKAEFEKIIGEKAPDVIISPFSRDEHPDHSTTGKVVEEIAAGKKVKLYEYVVHQKRFPQNTNFSPKYFLLPPANLAGEPGWKKFDLTTRMEELKSRAVGVYRTQLLSSTLRKIFQGLVKRNELFLEIK